MAAGEHLFPALSRGVIAYLLSPEEAFVYSQLLSDDLPLPAAERGRVDPGVPVRSVVEQERQVRSDGRRGDEQPVGGADQEAFRPRSTSASANSARSRIVRSALDGVTPRA